MSVINLLFSNGLINTNTNSSLAEINDIQFFGDSITYGMNASVDANCYASLLATYFNKIKHNNGISGTHLENYWSGDTNNFRDNVNSWISTKGSNKSLIVLAYGTNDGRGSADPAYYTPTKFYNQYNECIDIITNKGWGSRDILIVTPFYTKDSDLSTYGVTRSKYEEFVTQSQNVATNKNTLLFDAYHYMLNNGGDTLVSSDAVHPNDTGHNTIFTGLKNYLVTKIK